MLKMAKTRLRKARWRRLALREIDRTFDGRSLSLPFQSVGVEYRPLNLGQFDIRIRRNGNAVIVEVPESDHPQKVMKSRISACIFWFAQASPAVEAITVNLSDGDRTSGAQFAVSARPGSFALLPDFYFFTNRGYQEERIQAANHALPWAERSNEIVWRGQNTGQGLLHPDPGLADNALLNQRVRMALKAREAGIDFRFVSVFDGAVAYEAAGLMGERQPAATWLGRKFAVDVDGFSNAWDNFFHRLLFGCCVLKVESQAGFQQWYYNRLRPFEHFVPIRADLSDLAEKVTWVRENLAEAEHIAHNGQEAARAITFESETLWAGRAIDAVCGAQS